MNIQPVEQGTRKARKISLNRLLGAGASAGRVAVISAGHGFIAQTIIAEHGYDSDAETREIVIFESSIGWRRTSIA